MTIFETLNSLMFLHHYAKMPNHLLSVEETEVWPGETDTLTGHCPADIEGHVVICGPTNIFILKLINVVG